MIDDEDDISGYDINEYADIEIHKEEINAYNFTDEDDVTSESSSSSSSSSSPAKPKPKPANIKVKTSIPYNSILQEEFDFAQEINIF